MLVLGRRPGDQVMVGQSTIVTVIKVRPDLIDVTIDAPDELELPKMATLHVGDVLELGQERSMTLKAIIKKRARVGFSAPVEVKIHRKEYWDSLSADQQEGMG